MLQPAAGQLVEHLLVQRLVLVAGSHREEDVAADELVHDLAVGREAAEDDVLLLEPHLHLLDLPVDAPRLHVAEAPRLQRIAGVQVHADEAVERDAHQLLKHSSVDSVKPSGPETQQ